MERKVLVLVCILCVTSTAISSALAQGPPPFTDEWRELGLDLAEENGLFGSLELDDVLLSGAFISLIIDGDGGDIKEFTVEKPSEVVEIFRSVAVSPDLAGTWAVEDSVFTYGSASISISIHNNPTGGMVYCALSADLTVTFELGPDVSAVLEGRSVYVSGDHVRGRIVLLGEGSIGIAGNITVNLRAGSSCAFRTMLEDGEGTVGSLCQPAIQEAFGKGVIAAESFLVALEEAILSDTVSYLPVSISSLAPKRGVVEVTISSDLPSGKAIVLYLDSNVLGLKPGDRLVVELDGDLLPAASSADEALSSSSTAWYATSVNGDSVLVVSISSFSVHSLVITTADLLPLMPKDALGFAAVGIAGVVVAAAVAAAFRHTKRNW